MQDDPESWAEVAAWADAALTGDAAAVIAIGETVILLLHPPLPFVGVPTGMERGCQ